MTHLVYLGLLLGCIGCMAAVDRRFRLLLWSAHPGRGALVLGVGTAGFLVWDVVAIAAGFYSRGGAAMTGIELAPHLPLEELIFVVFLCYVTLLLHGLARRALDRIAAGHPDPGGEAPHRRSPDPSTREDA
ncbi:lycopene cyclase domain-containing protein [Isoptericola sp. NEAU-Y5]|uniref:Lycopene cyclase domain-containing protein n=1 Tax=Isoptericola luteus TaxID=2879484 RepID=A0ABS7ZAN0_9MICO|nr:lycopene cyclase domain-containing protein [Isoptericola sp. NEAU-Y5]MCA5892080.1 lycopene cyclase domain-containing protein [Isoptericola sp. NEAU-Y5]